MQFIFLRCKTHSKNLYNFRFRNAIETVNEKSTQHWPHRNKNRDFSFWWFRNVSFFEWFCVHVVWSVFALMWWQSTCCWFEKWENRRASWNQIFLFFRRFFDSLLLLLLYRQMYWRILERVVYTAKFIGGKFYFVFFLFMKLHRAHDILNVRLIIIPAQTESRPSAREHSIQYTPRAERTRKNQANGFTVESTATMLNISFLAKRDVLKSRQKEENNNFFLLLPETKTREAKMRKKYIFINWKRLRFLPLHSGVFCLMSRMHSRVHLMLFNMQCMSIDSKSACAQNVWSTHNGQRSTTKLKAK